MKALTTEQMNALLNSAIAADKLLQNPGCETLKTINLTNINSKSLHIAITKLANGIHARRTAARRKKSVDTTRDF